MKNISPSLAIALLLLAQCALAATPLQGFLSSHFEPASGAQASALAVNGSYYIVSAGGNETYVVGANGNAVTDISALTLLLEQDAKARDGYDAKISSAIIFASRVNAAKNASEAKCLQYIGDDGDPGCTDRQTCIVSCFSSPQCDTIVQSGGFIESAMDWDFARKNFSATLASYSDGIGAALSDPAAIDGKIAVLASLSELAQNMSQNSIFLTKDDPGCSGKNVTRRCYEYCPKIDYSLPLILSQQQNLSSLKETISKIASQRARAEAIAAQGAQNDAYLSTRSTAYEDFRISMLNSIRNLNAKSAELAKTVKDPSIAQSISALGNISAKARNYSDEGNYRLALAQRAQFEALSNSTSDAIASDGSKYSSLQAALKGISDKAKNSAWLIGNASASSYQKKIAALASAYPAPLALSQISDANAALSGIGNSLDSESASKAAQAGNSTVPPVKIPSSIPCLPALIPALVLAFASARRRV